jgi:two-component system response regulator GlrR
VRRNTGGERNVTSRQDPSRKISPFMAPGATTRAADCRAHDAPVSTTAPAAAHILVVEDQEDVRRMLVTALEIEGHSVDEAANALEGLKRLQEGRYNLVLSDYAMPGGTGTWMLNEATRQGLMDETVALIVTAHPDVRELADVTVITKPLDLDYFLEQVRWLLSETQASVGAGTVAMGAKGETGTQKVELVLYVSSASPASLQARRNLERVLARFDTSQVKFSICDLGRDPLAGEGDRIAFTPTLVKRFPEPRMWVLGNLRDADVLADLLRVCGVDSRE